MEATVLARTVSLILALILVSSHSVLAQELFAISTDAGLEFYQVEETLQAPQLGFSKPKPLIWPNSLADINRHIQAYRLGFSIQSATIPSLNEVLLVDPGFRTSLTDRVITVGGRIDWNLDQLSLLLAKHTSTEKLQ